MSFVVPIYFFCLLRVLTEFSISATSYKNVDIRLELHTAAFYYIGFLFKMSLFRLVFIKTIYINFHLNSAIHVPFVVFKLIPSVEVADFMPYSITID